MLWLIVVCIRRLIVQDTRFFNRVMIDPWLGKAAFHLGFYIAFTAGVLLFFLEKQTPEYVITQITFGIGFTFLAIIAILVRWRRNK